MRAPYLQDIRTGYACPELFPLRQLLVERPIVLDIHMPQNRSAKGDFVFGRAQLLNVLLQMRMHQGFQESDVYDQLADALLDITETGSQ